MINMPKNMRAEEMATLTLQSLYESYGYKKYKVSQFEEYGFYLKYKSFLQSERILSFTDLDGRVMALKPDITLSIIKNANNSSVLQKVYYHETVFRESAQSNTYREINQMGLEYIGEIDDYAICEATLLAKKSLAEINDKHVLELSHMGFVMGFLNSLEIAKEAKEQALTFISAKSVHELKNLASEQNLNEKNTQNLQEICSLSGEFDIVLEKAKSICVNSHMQNAIKELECVKQALENEDSATLRLDFTLLNDTEFYDGILMAGYINGIARPVLAGGRYDGMMQKLSKTGGAIGFAVYLSELEYLRQSKTEETNEVIILNENSNSAKLLQEVARLTSSGLNVTVLPLQAQSTSQNYKIDYRFTERGLEKC